jgi:hypothetical protein
MCEFHRTDHILTTGEQGVVDATAIVGYYSTLAMIMNVARAPGQPDSKAPKLAPFPH